MCDFDNLFQPQNPEKMMENPRERRSSMISKWLPMVVLLSRMIVCSKVDGFNLYLLLFNYMWCSLQCHTLSSRIRFLVLYISLALKVQNVKITTTIQSYQFLITCWRNLHRRCSISSVFTYMTFVLCFNGIKNKNCQRFNIWQVMWFKQYWIFWLVSTDVWQLSHMPLPFLLPILPFSWLLCK